MLACHSKSGVKKRENGKTGKRENGRLKERTTSDRLFNKTGCPLRGVLAYASDQRSAFPFSRFAVFPFRHVVCKQSASFVAER
jgi:hypothetical protein